MNRTGGFFAASLVCAVLQSPLFRSGVDLVGVDVLATNGGAPIVGLRLSDFEIRDNGVLQTTIALYSGEQPLDVVLVLDGSGSLAGERIANLRRAAYALIEELRDRDRAAVLTFADRQQLTLGFSSDKLALRAAVERMSAGGGTAIRDAVYGALCLSANTGRRTLIVLFSDGLDNRSWLSQADILDALRQASPVVAGVVLTGESAGGDRRIQGAVDLALFRALGHESGGETLEVKRATDLEAAFVGIMRQVRARYLVTYTPAGVQRSGWHELSVRLKGRPGTVVARRGYFVAER
jgi:VWFA-related protein